MDKSVIGLFPGSFKPPTRGHFEIVEKISKICNEVQIIISSQSREGYSPYISKKIWEQYKKLLPENVIIKVSESLSPITEIYQIVKDKSKDYLVVYGKGEYKRYKHINENKQKYENVDIFDVGNIEKISATLLRKEINERNLKEIKKLIPEGIKVNDFLLNFQLHEIKVNKPSIFPSQLLPYKDKIDHYIKYTKGDSEEKAIYTMSFILQSLYEWDFNIPGLNSPQELKDDTLPKLVKQLQYYIEKNHLNEIKVNNPVINFPEKSNWVYILKDEEEYNKINKILNTKGWENKSKYDFKIYQLADEYTILFPYSSMNKTYLISSARLNSPSDRELVLNKERLKLEENVIDESKNLGDLYHFTNLVNLNNILESNLFLPSSSPAYDHQRDFQSIPKEKRQRLKDKGETSLYYISLSRDKTIYKKPLKLGVPSLTRIQFNGNKLSTKYKFIPFNYYSDEIETEQDRFINNEGEERIILPNGKGIPNINNYINKIDILLDKIEDNETYLKQAEELIKIYPNVNLLYKEKLITMEEYKKTILPNIEPYRDEEILEIIDKTLNELFQPLNENIEVDSKLYIELLNKCLEECCQELNIPKPKLEIINDDSYTREHNSYGGYSPTKNKIYLVIYGRLLKDSCVTLCHEIYHHFDNIKGKLTYNAGEDGDEFENSANSFAGSYMRKFGRNNPEVYFMKYN